MAWGDLNNSQAFIDKCNGDYYKEFCSIELTIPTEPWKSKTIKAIQVGDLAIYFGDEPDIGLVIHVPTLTKFDRAIPDGEWTQDQLIGWCWKVQKDCIFDWAILKNLNNENIPLIFFSFVVISFMCYLTIDGWVEARFKE